MQNNSCTNYNDPRRLQRRFAESTESVPGGGAPGPPPPTGDGSHGDGAPHLDSSHTSHRRGGEPGSTGVSVSPTGGESGADSTDDGDEGPDQCPNQWTLTRKKRSSGGETDTQFIPMDCMRQGCPYCGPKLRRRKVAHFCRVFSALADDGYTLLFCSFTVDPKLRRTDTVEHCGEQLPLSIPLQEAYLKEVVWDRFCKRIRRRFEDLEYAGAVESHEDGRPHLHVMMAVRDSEDRSWRELNALVREQFFASGGGAVMDVKLPESRSVADEGEDTADLGDDGRPVSMSGSVGYLCKYMHKSAQERSQDRDRGRNPKKKPKMVLCSQGIGYNSRLARLRRRAVARGIEDPTEEDLAEIAEEEEGSEYEYETPFDSEDRTYDPGRAERARKHRREFFREHVTDEAVSCRYRQKVENHPEYGRTVWEVYTYLDEGVRQEVYDQFPEDERADLIDIRLPE